MRVVKREPDKGYLDAYLWVPKTHINVEGTKRALTFETPGLQAVKMFTLYKETRHHLLLPREFWRYSEPAQFEIIDCRPSSYLRTKVKSKITLDHLNPADFTQRRAVDLMGTARGGVLQLACGKGKTVCALELIARVSVPTIIVVDNATLLDQWAEAIEKFLDVPDGVGRVEGSKFDWKRPVVLATYQTLAQRAESFPEEFRRYFGMVIWDEGHHVGAPTFARTAGLFYGRRYCLTATPERKDGMHVVHELHVGPVLYKNLLQELKPKIMFVETGFGLNTEDPSVVAQTYDSRGELHFGMLAGYLGRWPERLHFIVDKVRRLEAEGRKVLVLSASIDELVNLLSIWNGLPTFYSDVPAPTLEDLNPPEPVGVEPYELSVKDRIVAKRFLVRFLKKVPGNAEKELKLKSVLDLQNGVDILRKQLELTPSLLPEPQKLELGGIEAALARNRAYRRLDTIMRQRQSEYLQSLLGLQSTAGLMIHDVARDSRLQALRDKQVTFAISKYGREGLDSLDLDTVVILEPGSQKGWIQQVMGRALRMRPGKSKEPLIEILEDDVGILHSICHNLKRHLRMWPIEEGGPFYYEILRPNAQPQCADNSLWQGQ